MKDVADIPGPKRQYRVKFRDGTYELVIAVGRAAAITEARSLRKQRRSALTAGQEGKAPEVESVKKVSN